jgi:hypothetical protein
MKPEPPGNQETLERENNENLAWAPHKFLITFSLR